MSLSLAAEWRRSPSYPEGNCSTLGLVISVVTIVKDDLQGFIRTRQSLEQQSLDMWEHIVVPASTEDSVSLYLEDLKNVRTNVRFQNGRGIYSAMNQGLQSATGEIVVFLNSGDCFANEDSLMRVAKVIEGSPSQWWILGGSVKSERGSLDVFPVAAPNPLSVGCGFSKIIHASVYYRKSFLAELGGFNETFTIAGDLELNLRAVSLAAPSIHRELVSIFYVGGISTTRVFTSIIEAYRARRMSLNRGTLGRSVSLLCFLYLLFRAVVTKLEKVTSSG